jgi:hypothetical protein
VAKLQVIRAALRPVFHWAYSGVFIPLFFGLGVTLALANRFAMAYAFFVLFAVWGIAYWLTSDWLGKKRSWLTVEEGKKARFYFYYEIGGTLGIIALAVGFIWWTYSIKEQFEQDDVFQKLSVIAYLPPAEDVFSSSFTVTNGGGNAIAEHQIYCGIKRITTSHWNAIENLPAGIFPTTSSLSAYGDAQSDECLSGFGNAGKVVCADVILGIDYQLLTQPGVIKNKRWRFVNRGGNDQVWHQQPIDFSGNYCPPLKSPPPSLMPGR